ncbi:disease resistance protein RGA2-like [Trifolium pratense]|uniref:disease resistance protein RGA2-like n=1 Tax=Trifolium pratense TaxID=57577 RepID=UPI001E69094C|nr:disease resistance protein RGA2-like [Trifolium pratense]
MAESLLFSVAETFIGKLTSRVLDEASLALGVYDDLRRIKDTSSLIKAVLLDAEQKQWQNNELREWLRQIKHVFSDAEDVIDDFECEALRMQVVNTSGSIRRKVRHYFSSSNPLAYRLKMAHQIKDINARLTKVAADRHNFGLQNNYSDTRIVQKRELTHSHIIESDVIGREHDKQIIIDLLLQDGDDKSLSVIPIVGMGGMGKTTLAKLVFNDERLGEAFQKKMWACVSHDFELKHLLVKILNSACDSSPNTFQRENIQNFDIEQLQNQLRNTLADQKFLLVLDDVWNENRVKWEKLKDLIQVCAKGSKVLVTTRSHKTADVMSTNTSHILEGLSQSDSLSVFVKWAFKEGEDKKHPELMEVGENIVRKCGGLPLAIRTLGSSLYLKFDIGEWNFVKDSEIWNLPQQDDGILPAIKLSYDQLPSYLKRCFACFSLFERRTVQNVVDVTAFWNALGFLPTPKQGENKGDIGKQLLHELWSRSFVQNCIDAGGFFSFELHDLVHDLALYVARDDFQLLNFKCKNIRENVRHLSILENDLVGQISIPTGLRTILFPVGANNKPFLNTCLSRCKYLRLLQLNKARYKNLPRSIGKLKHLRCLSLKGNMELERLPGSVSKLQNLQTLNLIGCEKLQKLPNGIGNLIKLQELYITTMQSNFPEELAKLSSLEILAFSNCDNLMFSFEGIQFPKLKLLSFSYCGNLKSLPFHIIPNIESLIIMDCNMVILSMGDNNNQIPNLKLKFVSLESLPQIVTFPQWLQGCANTLHSLGIENCENLEELPNWLSTFISLKNLLIENCPKLISLPEDVHHLPNLESLAMSGCPELYRRYEPEVGQDWCKISHIKEVSVELQETED